MSRAHKILIAAAIVLVAAALTWQRRDRSPPAAPVPFSVFAQRLEHAPAQFAPGALQIVAGASELAELRGQWKDGTPFVTNAIFGERLMAQLNAAGIAYEIVDPATGGVWRAVLAGVLPALVIVVIFGLLMRRLGSSNQGMRFRDSPARLATDRHHKTTFADIAGIEEAREEVAEIVSFLMEPAKFTRLGGRLPKGVLLMGPPGTGKTLLARGIAGEAGVPFFSISGSEFVEMFVGVGASRVRSLFEEAKKSAPCIIFVDELDGVGRRRGSGLGWSHDEREQTLNQLLVEMDGFEANEGVIIIAATNRPDVLDPALLRAGRFDRRIVIPAPDVEGRFGILQVHTRKTPLAPSVDLRVIARGTGGFVGAELSNLVNEAALLAARGDKDQLDMRDLESARDKVLMGPQRRSLVISARERRAMAYRQAGHALVGKAMKEVDPIHRVTIIPHGDALGITQQLPTEDRLNITEGGAHDRIAFALGGRVAEEIVLGEISTGSAGDIEDATSLARRMVRQWGMSQMGPLSFGGGDNLDFLGHSMGRRTNAEQTGAEIDDEVRRIVTDAEARVRAIVTAKRAQLEIIAQALLEHESIDGAELDVLLAGGQLARPALAG